MENEMKRHMKELLEVSLALLKNANQLCFDRKIANIKVPALEKDIDNAMDVILKCQKFLASQE